MSHSDVWGFNFAICSVAIAWLLCDGETERGGESGEKTTPCRFSSSLGRLGFEELSSYGRCDFTETLSSEYSNLHDPSQLSSFSINPQALLFSFHTSLICLSSWGTAAIFLEGRLFSSSNKTADLRFRVPPHEVTAVEGQYPSSASIKRAPVSCRGRGVRYETQ